MRVVEVVLTLAMFALVVACAANGPLYTEISAAIPSIPPNQGRIYFFRDAAFGGSTADISLNGEIVGKSEPGSFFYVDQNPGNCIVTTATETGKQLTFILERGRTLYVRTGASSGTAGISPRLVSVDAARTIIVNLHYTGPPLAKK